MKRKFNYYPTLFICIVTLCVCYTTGAQPPLPGVDDGSIVVPIGGLQLVVVCAAAFGAAKVLKQKQSIS